MTADWDSLVDAAPPEVRDALDRLRHHVVLTTPHAGTAVNAPSESRRVHVEARDAMGAVLAWMADQNARGEISTRDEWRSTANTPSGLIAESPTAGTRRNAERSAAAQRAVPGWHDVALSRRRVTTIAGPWEAVDA